MRSAGADTITLSSTQAWSDSDAHDMSGYTDWYLAGGTHKVGTLISHSTFDDLAGGNMGTWSYPGGTDNGDYGYKQATDGVLENAVTITIPIAQGTGQVFLWTSYDTSAVTPKASLNADFSVVTGSGFSNQVYTMPNYVEFVLAFSSSQAQNLVLGLNTGGNNQWGYPTNVGFTAVAMNQITTPEPSTLVLLAVGLIGLLAYAWRKRK